jgi:hypothetical protein
MKIFKFKSKAFTGLAFTGLLLGLTQYPASAITIDLFSDVDDSSGEQGIVDTTFGDGSVTDIDGSGTLLTDVMGGTRTITVEKLTNNSTTRRTELTVFSDDKELVYSSSSSTQGKFTVKWDGSGFGSGIDLTDQNGLPQNYFHLRVLENDNGVTLNFDVSDGTTTSTLGGQTLGAGVIGDVFFDYDDFSVPSVLQNAKSITLSSSTNPAALDFRLQFFKTRSVNVVPFEFSPSLGLILGGSLFGFLKLRSKFKASKINP